MAGRWCDDEVGCCVLLDGVVVVVAGVAANCLSGTRVVVEEVVDTSLAVEERRESSVEEV